jgi:hypothetical protein
MNDNILSTYTLQREASSNSGTLGEILDSAGGHVCYTCELPWLNNTPDTSCIPAGTYRCVPHDSPVHPNTWELMNVPGRDAILIHNGNAAEQDSKGCILVGDRFGQIDGFPAVLDSIATLNMLRQQLPARFILTIDGPPDDQKQHSTHWFSDGEEKVFSAYGTAVRAPMI